MMLHLLDGTAARLVPCSLDAPKSMIEPSCSGHQPAITEDLGHQVQIGLSFEAPPIWLLHWHVLSEPESFSCTHSGIVRVSTSFWKCCLHQRMLFRRMPRPLQSMMIDAKPAGQYELELA